MKNLLEDIFWQTKQTWLRRLLTNKPTCRRRVDDEKPVGGEANTDPATPPVSIPSPEKRKEFSYSPSSVKRRLTNISGTDKLTHQYIRLRTSNRLLIAKLLTNISGTEGFMSWASTRDQSYFPFFNLEKHSFVKRNQKLRRKKSKIWPFPWQPPDDPLVA